MPNDFAAMDESGDMNGGLTWDSGFPGSSPVPARLWRSAPQTCPIGSTDMIDGPPEWQQRSTLGRGHGSAASGERCCATESRIPGRYKNAPADLVDSQCCWPASSKLEWLNQWSPDKPPLSQHPSRVWPQQCCTIATSQPWWVEKRRPECRTDHLHQLLHPDHPLWRRNPEGQPLCNACGSTPEASRCLCAHSR